jgi:hypothetical protein
MFLFTVILFTVMFPAVLPPRCTSSGRGAPQAPQLDMSGKQAHKGGRNNKIHSKVCHACHQILGEALFKVGMWKGDRDDRRCKVCVDAKRPCEAADADAAAQPEEERLQPGTTGLSNHGCHASDGEDDDLFGEQDEAAANGAQLPPIASATPTTAPATPTPAAALRSPAKRSSPRAGGQYGNTALQVREVARAEAAKASQAAKAAAVQAQIDAAGQHQQELAALRDEVAALRADSDCRKEEQSKAEERAVVAAEMEVRVAAALNEKIGLYTVEAAKHNSSLAISEPLVGASVSPSPQPYA